MRKQVFRDLGRRLLIALLLCSALLLLRSTGYYDGIRERLERSRSVIRTESAAGTDSAPLLPVEAMLPLAVTVRSAAGGGCYGAAYDAEETAAVFRRFSVDVSEALGSAGEPAERTEEEFRESMNGCCVALQFICPVQLELLSGWFGIEMSSAAAAHEAEILCLSASETGAQLCYRTAEGRCYACTTAVSPDSFRSRAAEYAPNGALYAWESDRLTDGGYTLLLPSPPEPAAVKSAAPLPRGEEADAVLTAMGMNSFVTSSYTESDGTVVYVSDENTLRISPAGTVVFRRASAPEDKQGDLTASVSSAWPAAARCREPFLADGALQFAGAGYSDAQQGCLVLADYAVDGIPVRLASGHAAELVMRGETVIQARLQLRQFTRTEERTQLLPYLQAAAIAERSQGRAEIVYADAGEATACMWVIADG